MEPWDEQADGMGMKPWDEQADGMAWSHGMSKLMASISSTSGQQEGQLPVARPRSPPAMGQGNSELASRLPAGRADARYRLASF
ncbi:MAG TPA: hypothetical protein VF458_02500 [Ktedonobacteraceae bacterium]